jgi:UDP-3-O-[3-hydroxymyristoyl] glucosamine N-acyltransferase
VAGSARIGAHCMIGGAANITGHLEIADHVTITVATTVTRSIREPGVYSGAFPMDDNASWERNAATLRRLHELRERVKALEKIADRAGGAAVDEKNP